MRCKPPVRLKAKKVCCIHYSIYLELFVYLQLVGHTQRIFVLGQSVCRAEVEVLKSAFYFLISILFLSYMSHP